MTKEKLKCPQIPRALVDEVNLGTPEAVRAIENGVKTDQ